MATQARGGGFWRGFLTGLIVAGVLAVAAAIAFPPLQPPEVPEGSLSAPPAPGQPQTESAPEPGGILPAPAPGPLVTGLPAPETPPVDAPPAGAGSPSLVAPAQN